MSRNVVYFAIAFCILLLAGRAGAEAENRTMKSIEPSVAALLESTADDAYLIIGISGTADFVQMSGYQGLAELDFPQITPRQKELRPIVEKVCSDLGLEVTINLGSNGREFLDYELPDDTTKIAEMIKQILILVFGAKADTVLEFEANGFYLPAI